MRSMMAAVSSSAPCNGTAAVSAFVYIGADTDLSVLHHLRCGERLVLYVDPLTFWRNTAKIEQRIRSRNYDLDHLFECADCARSLHDGDVLNLSAMITDALPRLPQQHHACKTEPQPSCEDCLASNQTGVGGSRVQLHDWKHRPGPYDAEGLASSPIFEIRFRQSRQLRTLRYFASQAEDIDWNAVLHGVPVSTVAWVGANKRHVVPLLRHVCQAQPGTLLRTLSTKVEVFQRICEDMGGGVISEWEHLGCYCPILPRASVPCFGVSTFEVPRTIDHNPWRGITSPANSNARHYRQQQPAHLYTHHSPKRAV